MTRVAVLSHVKESTISASVTRVMPRIAWGGGKIVSNKDEALRKFYERKLAKGATLTLEQQRALEALRENANFSLPTTTPTATNHKHQQKTPKQMAHRAHVKVQATSHTYQHKKALVVNGRVVGPKVRAGGKANASRSANGTIVKHQQNKKPRSPDAAAAIPLQDKLSMSLDALVKRGK